MHRADGALACLHMASYCIHCGDRQAISESHRCNSCEHWTSPFELDNDAFGRLWGAAIKTVIEDFGIPAITWNRLVVAGAAALSARGWLGPPPPGYLTLRPSRPPAENGRSRSH